MKKKKKTIIFALGAIILTMAVCGIVIHNYKTHKASVVLVLCLNKQKL